MKPPSRERTLDIDRALRRYTVWAVHHCRTVLALGLVVFACSWGLASRLKIKGDFVSLLPTESGSRIRNTAA